MMTRLATPFVLAAITILGSTTMFAQREYREEFSITRPTASLDQLDIGNVNGSIEVIGVEGLSEAQVAGVKIVKAESEDEARTSIGGIEIEITEEGSTLNVRTRYPKGEKGISYRVDYEVRVPKQWGVTATNVNGGMKLMTLGGGTAAEVTNGSVEASDMAGALKIEVTNGSITADASIPENASCRLETVNGAIDGKLELSRNVACHVEALNGNVELSIPRSAPTTIAARTSTGGISIEDLSLANERKHRLNMVGAELSGTLGDGSGKLNLEVMNGSIALHGH